MLQLISLRGREKGIIKLQKQAYFSLGNLGEMP